MSCVLVFLLNLNIFLEPHKRIGSAAGQNDQIIRLPDGDVADIEVLHVVRALHVVVDHAFTCAAKRLDGVNLSLLWRSSTGQSLSWVTFRSREGGSGTRTHLHPRRFASFDDRHSLSRVYSVLADGVTVQVPDGLH